MSQEHIDFCYAPVSGPISGPSFVIQTEEAINELGEIAITGSNEAKRLAQEALGNAETAQSTANSALETAQDANTAAQNAVQTANSANGTAQAAQTTAKAAESRANEAYDSAVTADSKADTAISTANNANNTANTAISMASSANSTAQSANTTAQAAFDAANNANGYYTVVDESVNADACIESAEKSLITNAASTGFPAGLNFPLYFNVALEDSGRYSTQFCWSQDGSGSMYMRTGSLTEDEKGNAIASWGAWSCAAQTANKAAQAAQATAQAAQSSADKAYDLASASHSKAEAAVATANSANGKADMAVSTAEKADTTAQTAAKTAVWGSVSGKPTVFSPTTASATVLGGGFVATREELNAGVKNSGRGSSPAFVSVEQVSYAAFYLCEFYYFRHPTLKPGFQPAQGGLLAGAATKYPEAWAYLQTTEGQKLCKTEAQWQALTKATWATLADGTKVGWDGIGGAPFYAPNTATGALRLPDMRGMYPEAAGFDSLGVGGVHGDTIRNITGSIKGSSGKFDTGYVYGAFYSANNSLCGPGHSDRWEHSNNIFDASRVVPTAAKNQPRAWGALACVFLGAPK